MTTAKAPEVNPYRAVVEGEAGDRYSDLREAWGEVWALLTEGDCTRDELIEDTGLSHQMVKALTYNARQAGLIRVVNVTRKTEVVPNVWTVFTVRGYRAVRPDEEGTPPERPVRQRPWDRATP